MGAIRARWATAIILFSSAAAPALAQERAGAGPAAARAPSSLPTASVDIIVTARLREEDPQDVPAALSVVSGALLDRTYTVNTQNLTQLVPALNYSSANPRNTAFTIRGLGSSVVAVSQANDGLEPGVGFYVDGVYHARPATAAFDFSDVERVEVLRGPQGTLFGKNTTAGAISIVSRAPSFTHGGELELSYGDHDFVQARGAVTGPLVGDTVAFRLSGLTTRRDGVIRNVRSGIDHNRIDNQAVRAQLLIQASDALSVRMIADYATFDSNCCTQVPLRVGRSLRPGARQYPALAAALNYAPPSFDYRDRVTDIDAALLVDTNEGGVSGTLDWDLGGATLTSISAWRFWNWAAANDRDYLGLPIQLTQGIPSRQDQYSQELRLASRGEGAFQYLAGLYYFRQVITGRPVSIYGPDGAYWLIGPTTGTAPDQVPVPANLLDGYGQDGSTRFRVDSYAAFGEVNWEIAPRLTLTGGVRYTFEDKAGRYETLVFGGPANLSTALRNAQLSILRPQSYSAEDEDGSLSGRANVAYALSDDVLAYASYARGFKSGGINMSGLPLNAQNQPTLAAAVVDPERNMTYEAGLKTVVLDRRLTLNLAAYRTEVRDFQATIVDSTLTAALRGYLSNVPEVRVQGFEADADVRLSRDLSVRASLAYADGEYTDYPAGPCPLERQGTATTACDLSGQRLGSLPRWSLSVGVAYEGDLVFGDERGRGFVQLDSSSRSGFNGDPSLSRFTYIRGFNVTNLSIGYRSDEGWELALFARNLFDEHYVQNLTVQAGNSGLILGLPSDPRVLGATFRFRR